MGQVAAAPEGEIVHDVLVLGGGFGGMHMLWELRERGFAVIGLEAGENVGGAWYWNRYPGARCDVESLVYCYSFSPVIDAEWRWSERYSGQKEIRAYMSWVCDRLDIRKDYRFGARLARAHWDGTGKFWTFETEKGEIYRARYFVSSAGPISAPIWPNIPDREKFGGELYHTALWPRQEPDFSGKRVGVIGTGSSGTQLIPIVAEQAGHLTVFLRTPGVYTEAFNKPLTDDDYRRWGQARDKIRADIRSERRNGAGDVFIDEGLLSSRYRNAFSYTPEERRDLMERYWENGGAVASMTFADSITNPDANTEQREFLNGKIRQIVKDPAKAELLCPAYPVGTKRPCVGTHYLETFNRPNVDLVGVKKTPIERFTEKGLVVGGKEYELDVIISASGFDALTGALTVLDIRGENGLTIKDAWADGPHTFLGVGVEGFPNMLMIGGPGSPSVLTNVVMTNEMQVRWIADMLTYVRENRIVEFGVNHEEQEKWTQHVADLVRGSALEEADSWYTGANVPGKHRGVLAYTGGIVAYFGACNEVAEQGYRGFSMVPAADLRATG